MQNVNIDGLIITTDDNLVQLKSLVGKLLYNNTKVWLSLAKRNVPKKMRASFSDDFFKPHRQIKWLTPLEAIMLLTYHEKRVIYQPVIDQLQDLFGIKPLIDICWSRYEYEFDSQLIQLIKDIKTSCDCRMITRQVKVGRFYVDFKLTSSGKKIYIEYDDEAHQTKASYRKSDGIKNRFFQEQKLILIRVRRVEAERWLKLVRATQKLQSFELFYSDLFRAANQSTKRHYIDLSAVSLKRTLDQNPDLQILIPYPEQSLRCVKALLNHRLNITFYIMDKAIRFNESTLRNRCIYI